MPNESTAPSPELTPELIAKEEYEAQLFEFTVREYTEQSKSESNILYIVK